MKKLTKTVKTILIGFIVFALGLIGGYAGYMLAASNNSSSTSDGATIITTTALDTYSSDLTQVAETCQPSVVAITTEIVTTGQFMQESVSEGAGSGVIISEDGYIITNYHVIEDASTITVTLYDDTEYEAELIGSDSDNDIAVLKIEATSLTVAAIGDSDELQVGETVIAIGNPLGTLGGTVTTGIISATSRTLTIDDVEMTLLQTDAAVNPGNSGGGLFNTAGQLIGIVNAKISDEDVEGIGFAIPINQAITIAEQIIDNGGFSDGNYVLGITMLEITSEELARQYNVDSTGIYVYSVVDDSDAEAAGIESGDRLVSINGTEIDSADTAKSIIKSVVKGDTLTIVVERDGVELTLTVEV